MRFLHLQTAYSAYLEKFYAARPGLAGAGSAEQERALHDDAFGWADFWSHHLAERGLETGAYLVNAAPAQRAWAAENGVGAGDPGWLLAIAAAQVRAFAPEVLFLEDYAVFPPAWVREMRAQAPSIRLVVGWCGAAWQDAEFFKACDLVLSNIPALVETFRGLGVASELLRHGFDTRILGRLGAPAAARHAVSFVGSVGVGSNPHAEREQLLARIAARFPLEVFTPAGDYGLHQRARAFARVLLGRAHPVPAALRRAFRPAVFGLEMFRTLRASDITLNSHIAISAGSASNMRLFEATGAGACLLTDWKPDLAQLFDTENEVVAYRSPDECIEKIRYLLERPAERARIAAAGQARTLREHGFTARAADMETLLRRHLR